MKKNLPIIIIILIELAVLIAAAGYGIMQKRLNSAELNIPAVADWTSAYISPTDGVWSITDEQLPESATLLDDKTAALAAEQGEDPSLYPITAQTGLEDATRVSLTLLESPQFTLPAGTYTLTVSYATSVDQYAALRLYNVPAEDYKIAPGHISLTSPVSDIMANPFTLSRNKNVTEYRFNVKKDTPNVTVAVPYNHYGDLTIRDITLVPNMNGTKTALFSLFVLFALIDIAVFDLTHKNKIKKHAPAIAGIALITLAASLPLLLHGAVIGQDEYFHLMRIDGLAEALKSGQIPVRMQALWMDGFGYPVSVYYGDLLLYIPAILRIIGFSVNASYKMLLVLLNLATAVVTYLCMKRMFKKDHIALITTAGYTVAIYRMLDMYARSAVGEAMSFIFFPIIALALWNMYGSEKKTVDTEHSIKTVPSDDLTVGSRDSDASAFGILQNAILISIGMSGLMYSHTLSVAMTAAFLAIVVIVFIKRTFSKQVLLTWIGGVVGTILLSLAFLIPLLDYTMNVTTNTKVNEGEELIQWGGVYLYQYFMVFQQPFGGNSIDIKERLSYTPGLILMIAFVAAIVHIILRHTKKKTVYMFVFSVIAMWLASNVFPWDFLSQHVTKSVATIQFPWRFVGIACICLALLLGCLIETITEHALDRDMHSKTICGITAVFAFLMLIQSGVFFAQYSANDYRNDFMDTAELDPYAVTSFFLREGIADDEPLNLNYPKSSGITEYEILGRNGSTLNARVVAGEGSFLEFPVFYYPYYHMYDEAGNELPISDGSHHLIRTDFSAGYNGSVKLCYNEPVLWRIAELITVATFAGILIVAIRGKHEKTV